MVLTHRLALLTGGETVGFTTIKIAPATRDRLKALGTKGQTYDALLNRLLDEIEARIVRIEKLERAR